ncbi:amino acid ABC transporter substrate-binding protein [Enterococcus sp. LJL120]
MKNKNRSKKIFASLLLLVLMVFLGSCGILKNTSGDTWETIQSSGKVTIGLDDTFVPMGFRDQDGYLVGFDVDLATAVFAEYGIEVDFQPIDWSLKEMELTNGTIDLIWNGYSVTPAREEKVLFSNTYMENDQVLITRKDSGITSFADMQGKVLGAQTGSSGYDAFTQQPEILKDLVADEDAVLYSSFNEAFIDLEHQRIDGLLIDHVYANYYLSQTGDLENYNLLEGGFVTEDFAVGARKTDTTLVAKINDALKALQSNGKFLEISDKWFGEDVSPK